MVSDDVRWKALDSLFEQEPSTLVEHQLSSYDNAIKVKIPEITKQYNPSVIYSGYDASTEKYNTKININFGRTYIRPVVLHENNGRTRTLNPAIARLRNYSYVGNLNVDIEFEYHNLSTGECNKTVIPKALIGKIPIMHSSCICVTRLDRCVKHKECEYDPGGYFIIHGSEKVIVSQERQAESKPFCYFNCKGSRFSHILELKSALNRGFFPTKTTYLQLLAKPNNFGRTIWISCPNYKTNFPLLVIFYAFGVTVDSDIVNLIMYELKDYKCADKFAEIIEPTLKEGHSVCSCKDDALKLLAKSLNFMSHPREMPLTTEYKLRYVEESIDQDLYPHIGKNRMTKAKYLGYLVRHFLLFYCGNIDEDDRDRYDEKRIDSPGIMFANLFRQAFTRQLRDMRNAIMKDVNNRSGQIDWENFITPSTIYKFIKATTIENALKYSLATGNWGLKMTNIKVGVAQVLNRISYTGTLSHLRRVNTPIERTSKTAKPRQQHGTGIGYICSHETPEGASIGIVKNLALTATITTSVDSSSLKELLLDEFGVVGIENAHLSSMEKGCTILVFINGEMFGIHNNMIKLNNLALEARRCGRIHIHTSISPFYKSRELHFQTSSGRLTRPLFIIKNQKLLYTDYYANLLEKKMISWDNLIVGFQDIGTDEYYPAVIEYLDTQECDCKLIASDFDLITSNTTHCELHPSMMLGVSATTIPFPNHNQAPRVTYQSAMGKQAMGIYAMNFRDRIDTLANILQMPMRPFVQTRAAKYVKMETLPSGSMTFVAIMTKQGYNQEDSIIMNQAAIDRGMFRSTFYRTYQTEERKSQITGDEEQFCKPNIDETVGMKYGGYDNMNADGIPILNSLIQGGSPLIGKVVPIKANNVGIHIKKKYRDTSLCTRNNECGRVDSVYVDHNADGYRFCKAKVRNERIPQIGDKFACATREHDALTQSGWKSLADLDMNDLLAVYDPATSAVTYEKPLQLHEYDVIDQDMYDLKSAHVDLFVTTNHNLYARKRDHKDFELIQAGKLVGKRYECQTNIPMGRSDYEDPPCRFTDRAQKDAFLWLVGHWVGDGCMGDGGKSLLIGQSKPRKKLGILLSCHRCGIKCRQGEKFITIRDAELTELLAPLALGAANKQLPEWALNLSPHDSRMLMHGLISSDGSINKTNSFSYYSISTKLCDQIQILAAHIGWASIMKLKEKGGRQSVIRGKTVTSRHDYYQVRFTRKKCTPTINHGHTETQSGQSEQIVKFTGKVYCPSVRTGIIMMRRNGKVFLCGNSRHAQKGTIGMIFKQEDMPYTADGMCPDAIINPHAIPSRMTQAHLMEMLLGWKCVKTGTYGDGTPFNGTTMYSIMDDLKARGFNYNGQHVMYCPTTGRSMTAEIYMGPIYYQRLKHMVQDKIHSRANGPVVMLTRQPSEGRSRDGGLRIGEMERDCFLAHGIAQFLKEKFVDLSDGFSIYVSSERGTICPANEKEKILRIKDGNDAIEIRLPYACKLLIQELQAMGMTLRLKQK